MARADDGKTVFVEGGVPGDLVRVQIEREQKQWARGRVDEVIEASPMRVEPHCPHFSVCGGCTWQHIDYAGQVEAKASILRDALERIGGFPLAGPPSMTASPQAYGYRGRARVLVRDGRPGYRERASHRHCVVSQCPVLAPELEAALRDWRSSAVPGADDRERSADGEWSLCVGRDGALSRFRQLVPSDAASRDELPSSSEDVPAAPPGDGPACVEIEVAGRSIAIDAQAFSQANRLLYSPLASRVLEVLTSGVEPMESSGWRVLEVHAGVGFLTLPLARQVAHVVAVEAEPHAVELLRRNLASATEPSASVDVVEAFFGDAGDPALETRFDAVVLDPPRAGLTPAEIERLVALAPERIVYLSCDPATLARDARSLCESGWRLCHVEGFDLFPQTPHTEGLIRLERSRPA